MASKLKNRTVESDGEAIQRLRIEKGWRVEDLADKAKCSLKTVENVERGANVYLYTLRKFAQALGVEVSALMLGAAPPDPPKKGLRFKVQFTFDVPFQEFDESERLGSFLTMLRQILQAKDEIVVVGVQEGSTIVTLEMGMDDIERLIYEFTGRSALAILRVAELKLPDDEDFTLTQTVELIDEGRVVEEPLRGRVIRRGSPAPAPKRTAFPEPPPEKPRYDLPENLMKPPVPEHKPADTDADE